MHKNNERIIYVLKFMSILREEAGELEKSNAYKKAVSSIEKYDLTGDISSGKQAKDLKGIGYSISKTIDLVLKLSSEDWLEGKTGVDEIDNLDDDEFDRIDSLITFMGESGIGKVKASKFYDEGHRSVESIRNANPSLKTLKYSQQLKERVKREDVKEWFNYFDKTLGNINDNVFAIVAGSYIRGAKTVGDLDIVLYSDNDTEIRPNLDLTLKKLIKDNYVKEILMEGNSKYRIIASLSNSSEEIIFQVDFEIVSNYRELPFRLLYFTGPESLNRSMYMKASELGYHMSNKELIDKRTGENVWPKDEKEIFKILGMTYLKPNQRS